MLKHKYFWYMSLKVSVLTRHGNSSTFCQKSWGCLASIWLFRLSIPYLTPSNVLPFYVTTETGSVECPGLNVSITPLRQWGFGQCLPFSWTTLRGNHCRHQIAVMGVVDMFEPGFAVLSTLPKSCDLSEGMVDLSPA
jgi:hypothetical protein